MVILCSIIAPPPPKIKKAKTIPRSNKYYTIHSHMNNVFGVKIKDETPSLMVGFKNYEDAFLMARMLETYYNYNENLPVPCKVNEFVLPSSEESVPELNKLTILHNDTDNLVSWCMINFLDFLGVEEVIENNETGKYSWDISIYCTEPDFEICKERFDYLYQLENE